MIKKIAWTLFIVSALVAFTALADCRNPAVKRKFDKLNGYPHGRKGYVVDHICPLEQGGLDDVVNMQYQTIAEGKAKDKIELTPAGKAKYCNAKNSTPTRKVFNCKAKVKK